MQKLGKIKRLAINENFRVKYGTINYKQPQSIYLILESWIQPSGDYDFDKEVRTISKQIRQTIYKSNDRKIFLDDVFVNVDLRSSGMSNNKRSFMSIEVTLFPQKITSFPNDEYKVGVFNLSKSIITDLIAKNKNYTYNTSKKIN